MGTDPLPELVTAYSQFMFLNLVGPKQYFPDHSLQEPQREGI